MYIMPRQPEQQTSMPVPPPAPRPQPSAGGGFRINVLKSVQIHAVTASLVALLTLGLGLAVLLRHHATYLSGSIVYVSPNFPKTLTEDRELEYPYETYIQEEMHAINRYDVIAESLHKLPMGVWQKPGESEQSAVQRLQQSLEITRVGMTYQVQIALRGPHPDKLADIVNTVTDTYIEKAKEEEFYGRDERLQNLRDERTKLRADLDARLQEQADITKSLGVAVVGGSDPFDSSTDKTRGDLLVAHAQRIAAEAQLASLEHGDPNAPNSALSAAADEIAASDPGLMSLKTSLGTKRSELLNLISGLTPNNPLRKQTEDQLAQTEAALQKMQTDLRARAAARLEQKLHTEVNRASIVESRLQSDLQHNTSDATSAAPKLQRAGELKTDIERLQARYTAVDDRINSLELESSSPGSVHVFQPARKPLAPEPSKAEKLLLALLPISLLMGVAAAVAFDLLDPHIYTGRDVESVLGFAPIGVLLNDSEVTQMVFDECTLRLAGGIDHAAHAAGVRTFVVTSVTAGAGTTTIIGQLGSTLAKLGRKTLTVDATGTTNPVAYTTVNLNDRAEKQEFSKETSLTPANLDIQTSVVTKSLPSKTPLTTSFMAKAFQELTNDYDIVLIDASPLMASAESEYLARFADVTILVSEAGKTKKGDLKRAAKLLERLNVSGVAAIINKVGLLRAEKELKQDVAEFEARVQKTNLRWKPKHTRPETSSPFASSFHDVEEEAATETVTL